MTSRSHRARRTLAIDAKATAAVLASIAGLHVAWAHGSSLPFRTRDRLHDAVLGAPTNRPSALACYTVAAALTLSSATVLRAASRRDRASRPLARVVAFTLATRGTIGLLGQTHRYMPGPTSQTFRRLDRSVYSPLCLALAVGAVSASRPTR
jgi:hypothetical protein